jgi:hypothetical protein
VGDLIIIVLRLVAVLFSGAFFVFVIFPAHLIHLMVGRREPDSKASNASGESKCPNCMSLVIKEAWVCKHCGFNLIQC